MDRTYAQCKGLAMGNRLAQSLTEIRTNHALLESLKVFDATQVSLFYKYVDDVLSAAHRDIVESLCAAISTATGMSITTTKENNDSEIDFLNCTFKRNADGSVSSKWFKKKCCSFQTLNYHSYHRWSMKDSNTKEMIQFALNVTSPEFREHTKSMLIKILYNSSYPSDYIQKMMYKYEGLISPILIRAEKPRITYVSCPSYRPTVKVINDVISQRKIPVKINPSPFSNNRQLLLSRVKDVHPDVA